MIRLALRLYAARIRRRVEAQRAPDRALGIPDQVLAGTMSWQMQELALRTADLLDPPDGAR